MRHQQHHRYNGSVQISAAASNLSHWNENGTDPYVRYIHSVHSLERQKAINGSMASDEKIGGVRKFATSIGNLLKSKQTNCQLNKLNEIQSPKPNKDRGIRSVINEGLMFYNIVLAIWSFVQFVHFPLGFLFCSNPNYLVQVFYLSNKIMASIIFFCATFFPAEAN